MKMKKIIFCLVFILGFLLRAYKVDRIPPSLFFDEADLGYQAYSFLKTGRDYFGGKFPVSFHSFADFRASLYIYSAAFTVKLFGMNEWGVRLPAVIFGILGLFSFFLLAKEISKNDYFSIIATLFLTILPWHFFYSRAGFEVSLFFFLLTLGLWLFLLSTRKKSYLDYILSLLCFSLTFYAYATARMFVPLLGFFSFLIYRKEILNFGWRKFALSGVFVLLMVFPFIRDSLAGRSMFRFSYINIFYDSNLKYEIDRQRLIDSTHDRVQKVGMSPAAISYLFHNKPLFWFWEIIANYFSGYSSNFLFISGDPNLRQGVGRMGNLLVVTAPLLILGVVKSYLIIKNKEKKIIQPKEALLLLTYFIIAPLPSSITFDGGTHATRLFLCIIPLTFFISLGFFEVMDWFKSIKLKVISAGFVLTLVCLNFVYYLHIYFYHFPIDAEKFWQVGFKEAINLVAKNESGYDKVIISNFYEPPLIFFLFWTKYNPEKFNPRELQDISNEWFDGKRLNKFYFGQIGTGLTDSYLKSILLGARAKGNSEKILVLAGRNDFGGDLEKSEPFGLKVIDKVYLNSHEPVFYLLRSLSNEEL